jgi:hypothetical protein
MFRQGLSTIMYSHGVRLSPLGTAATVWPIVSAPDDRWWLWSNGWNANWQRKPKYSEKTCPSATLSNTNPTWTDPGSNPGRRGGKPATNRLSYGTTHQLYKRTGTAIKVRPHYWRIRERQCTKNAYLRLSTPLILKVSVSILWPTCFRSIKFWSDHPSFTISRHLPAADLYPTNKRFPLNNVKM